VSCHFQPPPGDSDPTPFQRSLQVATVYYELAYFKAHGKDSRVHEHDAAAATWFVYVECRGDSRIVRGSLDSLGESDALKDTLFETCVSLIWMSDTGFRVNPPVLTNKWRALIEHEIVEKAAAVVRGEREQAQMRRRA
jgi:hypothetical protein